MNTKDDEFIQIMEQRFEEDEQKEAENNDFISSKLLDTFIFKTKEAMKVLKISQDDIANELGVRQSTISQWFAKKRKLPRTALMQISKFLKIHTSYYIKENMTLEEARNQFNIDQLVKIQLNLFMYIHDLEKFISENYGKDDTGIKLISHIKNMLNEYIEDLKDEYPTTNRTIISVDDK